MTTTTNAKIVQLDAELNEAILNGQALDAFERFYAENVVMQENDAEPTVGKDANRVREQEFMSSITAFRGAKVLATGSGNNVTFSHWYYDFDHKDWGTRDYRQVAVRTWENDRIVKEVFYYG